MEFVYWSALDRSATRGRSSHLNDLNCKAVNKVAE